MTSQYRCKTCARSKVRCSRSLPCERCFTTCGPKCEPPDALQRRHASTLDLVFSLLDRPSMKESLCQAITSLYQSGRLNMSALLEELAAWNAMSERVGEDVTHGAMSTITAHFGLAELKQEAHIPDPPAILQLECSPSYSALADKEFPVFIFHTSPGGCVVLANKAASELFVSSAEINDAATSYKLLPGLALAGFVAPEDRELWFEAVLFSIAPLGPLFTTFIKVASRDLDIELYIMRAACATLEGVGGRTTVLTLEAVPTSKHITRRPGHRHKLLDVFRQRGNKDKQGPSVEDELRIPPPLTCLPLPPLSPTTINDLLGVPSGSSAAAGAAAADAPLPSITWPPVQRLHPPSSPTEPSEASQGGSFAAEPPRPLAVAVGVTLPSSEHPPPTLAEARGGIIAPQCEPAMDWLEGVVGPDGEILAPETAGSMDAEDAPDGAGEAGHRPRGDSSASDTRVFSPSDTDILLTLLNSPTPAQSSGSGDGEGAGH